MSNITASNTAELLESSARLYKYFWNGLFAALYEDVRKDNPVEDIASGNNPGYLIPASPTVIKNYLSCKTKKIATSHPASAHAAWAAFLRLGKAKGGYPFG